MKKNLPNVIFIVLDSARRDLFGAYGSCGNLTPFLDQLSRESLVMMDHYAAGCGSSQAHVSMFLGQHSARHKVVHNMSEMQDSVQALPMLLSQAGYQSYGHCMASFIPPAGYEDLFGFNEFFYPGKGGTSVKRTASNIILDKLKEYPQVWKLMKSAYGLVRGEKGIVRAAAKSLDGKSSLDYLYQKLASSGNVPTFAYTTLLHPHTPYAPPKWCIEKIFGRNGVDALAYTIQQDMHAWVNGDFGNVDASLEAMKMLYEAEMVYADSLIEQFVGRLKKEGMFDNTVLIVTSDHGELFGEHGQLNHGATVWEEIYRLPLFIYGSDHIFEKGRYEGVSSGLDIVPTVLDLVGLGDLSREEVVLDGVSLFDKPIGDRNLVVDAPPLVLPERLKKYPKVLAKGNVFFRAVRNSEYKYLWQSNGVRYLFKKGEYESPENCILKGNNDIADALHEIMVEYYRKIDPVLDISSYPINMGVTAAKKMTNPIIQKELKKLGYL